MKNVKAQIYKILKNEFKNVMQQNGNIFNELPCVTFYISDNSLGLTLDNEIAEQYITVIIDIWTKTSKEGIEMLEILESIMRKEHYKLDFSADIPQDNQIYHTTTRFTTTI